jgi:hypothetical protein
MLNWKQTITIVLLIALVAGIGWFDRSQQPPKAINENHRPATRNYEPNATTPFRIFTSNGLKEITKYCNSYSDDEKKKWPQGYYCDLRITDVYIALFSGLLVFVTGGVVWVGFQQYRDTRILQRAYVSAEPLGIHYLMERPDALVAHVKIINAGNLPAQKVKWRIQTLFSRDGEHKDFEINPKDLSGDNVISPQSEMIQGNNDILSRAQMVRENDFVRQNFMSNPDSFVYVYGLVIYEDGFGKERKLCFCHRYPCITYGSFGSSIPGTAGIAATDGRQHQYGNSTT